MTRHTNGLLRPVCRLISPWIFLLISDLNVIEADQEHIGTAKVKGGAMSTMKAKLNEHRVVLGPGSSRMVVRASYLREDEVRGGSNSGYMYLTVQQLRSFSKATRRSQMDIRRSPLPPTIIAQGMNDIK